MIWHSVRRHLGTFSLHMRRNSVNSAFGLKTAVTHRVRRPRFPIRLVQYFHYWMTFAAYIWWFCAWPLNFWPWRCLISPFSECTYQLLSVLRYPFLSYGWLSLITLYTITCNGHCVCAVSRDQSPTAKMIHVPVSSHFVIFRALRRKFSYVKGEK